MSVSTALNKAQFTGDGVATAFGFTFPISTAADLKVYLGTVLQTISTDYTVAAPNSDFSGGGTCTFLAIPADGALITLERVVALTHPFDLTAGDPVPAEVFEDAVDRLQFQIQQLSDKLARAITIPTTDPATLDMELVPQAQRTVNQGLLFNASGEPIVGLLSSVPLSAFMQTVADDVDADQMMDTLLADQSGVLHLEGASAADRTVRCAADASVLWDESEDEFVLDKQLRLVEGVEVANGVKVGFLAKSGNYTITDTDPNIIFVTAASDVTITLPANATNGGRMIKLVKVDSGTGKLIIARAGSDTLGVNAVTTMELWFQDNWVDLMADVAGRWIVTATELFIIPDDKRANSWLPSAGAATTPTDVDWSARVPAGTRLALAFALVERNIAGEVIVNIRRNGSTTNADIPNRFATSMDNGDVGRADNTSIIELDANGIFEYWHTLSNGSVWMAEKGYRLG